MRHATAILITLLLFVSFQSCSTAKKATAKEETRQETAAAFDQQKATNETAAATFDQAILEQILNRVNVTFDFERWDFAGQDDETPPDSLPAAIPTATADKEARDDKPPNIRPTSYTKGSVNINAEERQNRTTQTSAGSQVNKSDSTTTAANVEKKDDRKAESKEQEAPRSYAGLWVLLLIAAGAALYFFGQHISRKP